jgi:hypothetical protein
MITVDKLTRSPRYLIAESAVSFTENYQGVNKEGNPIYDVVAVSVSSEAAIMVFDENNGISYGDDLQYQRWRLNGVTTGLVSTEAHNIYARLNKEGKKEATIIFSVRNYRTDGSYPYIDEDGLEVLSEPSAAYYYILIGTLTALDGSGRTLTFDPGRLSTRQQQNEQGGGWVAEMFELVRDAENLIRAKLRFENLRVKGESLFDSIANFYNGIKIGPSDSAKSITSVATDLSTSEDATDAAATPAYVKAFSEGRYLSKTATDPQSVAGPVTFEQDVTVEGDQAIGGNQTIDGEQEVKGLQTLYEGFKTAGFSNVGGTITGAQLTSAGIFSAAGLIANSLEVFELIYNVIRAQGGKMVLSNAATIESCQYKLGGGVLVTPDEYYASHDGKAISSVYLTIKKEEHNKNAVPFKNGDILYGYVNKIGDSGQYARGGECVMQVITDDTEIGQSMTIEAALFEVKENDTSGNYVASNIPPTNGMTIAQRGNVRGVEGRTSSFFIDSEASNIIMLSNVTKPTIGIGDYGMVHGKLPSNLYLDVKRKAFAALKEDDPVSYVKYLVAQNFIQYDHQGNAIQSERNRGTWYLGMTCENTTSLFDVVTHNGQLWKCLKTTTSEPSANNSDWLLLVSKGDDATERYRGQWNLEVALGNVEGEEKYTVTKTTHDTVTHNGSMWRCMQNHTTVEPHEGAAEWEITVVAGKDSATASIYELKPSVNTIYYRTSENRLSVSRLDVVVGETDAFGYTIIDEQAVLGEKGLAVYYAIDGDYENKVLLNISPSAYIELEDGSILASDDDSGISLEGDDLDVSSIKDNITLYLVDDADTIRTTYVIPVVKDGSSAIHAELDNEMDEVALSWDGEVVKEEILSTTVSLWNGDVPMSIAELSVETSDNDIELIYEEHPNSPTATVSCKVTLGTVVQERNVISITVKSGDVMRTLKFVIAGVKAGEKGDTPDLYDLRLTASQIVRKEDGTTFPTHIGCDAILTRSGEQIINPSGVTLKYSVDGGSAFAYTEPINTSSISNIIKFELWVNGILRDSETVSVVSDGKKGDAGISPIILGLSDTAYYVGLTSDGKADNDYEFEVDCALYQGGERISFDDIQVDTGSSIPHFITRGETGAMVFFTIKKGDEVGRSNIYTIILTDNDGKTYSATYTIVGVPSGADSYTFHCDPLTINVQADAQTKKLLQAYKKTITLYVRTSYGKINVEDYDVVITTGNVFVTTSQVENINGNKVATLSFSSDLTSTNLPNNISVDFNDRDGNTLGTLLVPVTVSERGFVGATGAQIVPYGYWKEGEAISLGMDGDRVVTRPIVFHQPKGAEKGTWYALKKNISAGENTSENLGNSTWWDAFTQMRYILAEAIMADWAKFSGAIFYNNYMFSDYGIGVGNPDTSVTHADYVGGDTPMFDANGRLTGDFVPHLFLDLLHGGAKFGKLSESFIELGDYDTKHIINLEGCHNVKHKAHTEEDGGAKIEYAAIVALPSGDDNKDWFEDGTNCTVVHGYDMIYSSYPTEETFRNAAIAICADERMLDANKYIDYSTFLGNSDENGWFVWKGYRTKVIFLAPGSMLKLRSVKTKQGGLMWFVENSGEFELLDTVINFYNKVNGVVNEDGTRVESRSDVTPTSLHQSVVFIGSPVFNKFAAVEEQTDNNGYTHKVKTMWAWNASGVQKSDKIAYLWHE